MPFLVSPGVVSVEQDLTLATSQTISTTDGAFAGPFLWGPIDFPVLVSSENDLVTNFGPPDSITGPNWFCADNFLQYGSTLRVARCADIKTALNATANAVQITGTVSVNGAVVTGVTTTFTTQLVPGQTILLANSSVSVALPVLTIASNTSLTVSAATANGIANGNIFAFGVLCQNDDVYTNDFLPTGNTALGPWMAKFAGALGSGLKVSVCPSAAAFSGTLTGTLSVSANGATVTGSASAFNTQCVVGDYLTLTSETQQITAVTNSTSLIVASPFVSAYTATTGTRKWEFASAFAAAPGTSPYVTARSGSGDEMHVAVCDTLGKWSGVIGALLETYSFASKASDALAINGSANYYQNLINSQSQYVRWLSHIGANWGSASASTTFTSGVIPVSVTLQSGLDGNATASDADTIRSLQTFSNPEQISVSLLFAGATSVAVANELVDIAQSRTDCIALISPPNAAVVNNSGGEVAAITTFRNSLPSTSYAVLDSGWKYQFDRYNNVYLYVPLCGDIAGLCARTDMVSDPWFSPAGVNRGQILNSVKLAWNPTPSERDDLYKIGVNAVVSLPAQGTMLYGDKTLLSRPSVFDRINVRRLMIVLEKTIAVAARSSLFELNDDFTRAQFISLVQPFLAEVKAQRGIVDFKVVCDQTNNTTQVINSNSFVGDVYIQPARAINFITLNFIAGQSGVTFNESQASVTSN